jgi:hypothetical protein
MKSEAVALGHPIHPVLIRFRSRSWALVHESEPARNDPNPQARHRPTAYDAGLPR